MNTANRVVVAGVDFGTLNVRVSIFDNLAGRLGSATAEYPLARRKDDPDYATQSHRDHMAALAAAMRQAVAAAGIRGDEIAAMAMDTTGSSVVPVDAVPALAAELWSLARWLDLADVVIGERGDLARILRGEVKRAARTR